MKKPVCVPTITDVAEACHEINRAYCRAIGDDSQLAWADAPEWQRSSAVAGVKFHLANPDASPSASHESWLVQKTAEGWKYGEVKDPEKKEHPCFVPYSDLPKEQQAKDYLFKQVVHSFMPFIYEDEPVPAARADQWSEADQAAIRDSEPGPLAFNVIKVIPGTDFQPTHKCTICGALWKYWPKEESNLGCASWQLRSSTCGKCCDNAPMGDQIVPLDAVPTPAFAENSLPGVDTDDLSPHNTINS